MYMRTRDMLGRIPTSYIYDSSSLLGLEDDQGLMLGEGDPSIKHRDLIFFGYSGAKGDGKTERDFSYFSAAATVKEHIAHWFPGDDIEIICAWHKNTFVKELMTPSLGDPKLKIRQIHYVGHGFMGGLYFGYKNKIAVEERRKLLEEFQTGSLSPKTDPEKRIIALERDAGLMSGFFSDALAPSSLRKIKDQLTGDTLMHIWGCFAGTPEHTFDTTDNYWNLFNAAGAPVHGIARHIAESLEINVTAVLDPQGIGGMNFCFRDTTGKFNCTDERPGRPPHWLWPKRKSVRWITYDPAGKGDEKKINFLGQIISPSKLKPGEPPRWFTKEIPVKRAKTKPRSLPACYPAAVAI
jgi:hypothetical protein